MAKRRYILGLYKDDEVCVEAVKKIRAKGIEVHDVLSPFPVHGMDEALGLKESRLHIGGFFFGISGTTIALSFMTWVFTSNWPINFGGKPHFSFPAFIPITFEFTVLCAAFGMVFSWLVICRMYPGKIREILDPRTTDDMFGIVFQYNKRSPEQLKEIETILNETGAAEIKHRELPRRY